jgi:hypothetical protein
MQVQSPFGLVTHLECRATALHIIDNALLENTLVVGHRAGEGLSWLPLGRVAGSSLLEHLVDLLQGQALGLGDQEVGVDESAGAKTTPDEEDRGAQVALVLTNHVGGDDSNNRVPQPVGGSGQTDTARTDGQREDLANDNPCARSPGGGEEENEDGNEGNLGVDSRDVVGKSGVRVAGVRVSVVEADRYTNDGHQELADQHTESTPEEDGAAAKLLDSPEGDGSGADVDQGEDQGDQEGVVNGTSRLQEGSRVVEDEVDTSPLLHHLEGSSEDRAAQVGLGLPQRPLEAVGPAGEPTGAGDQVALILLVGNDLGKFDLDVLRLARLATKATESIGGSLDVASLDKVTGRVGQEEKTNTEDQAPGELDGDGNAIGTGVIAVLGRIHDDGGQHDTDGDAELVASDQSATDLARALQAG